MSAKASEHDVTVGAAPLPSEASFLIIGTEAHLDGGRPRQRRVRTRRAGEQTSQDANINGVCFSRSALLTLLLFVVTDVFGLIKCC